MFGLLWATASACEASSRALDGIFGEVAGRDAEAGGAAVVEDDFGWEFGLPPGFCIAFWELGDSLWLVDVEAVEDCAVDEGTDFSQSNRAS